mmetsp:Transcript_7954/g.16128  ORF Transcript_7954/g.16128 Transcript_7954/m.16128 type:complete len:302 (+) Transcript_7954:608-1513(+)
MSDNNGSIINYLLFLHPPCIGLLHKAINRLGGTRGGFKKFYGFIILHKFPKSISGNDNNSVCGGVELFLGEFRVGNNTSGMCDSISEGTGHSKSWNIHVSKPNAGGSVNTVIVFHGEHSTSSGNDTLLLLGSIGLVIMSEFLRNQLTAFLHTQDDPTIPNIDPDQLVPPDYGHRQRCPAELRINSKVTNHLVLHLRNRIRSSLFDVRGPTGVRHHLHGQLIAELGRDAIPVFSVPIQNAKDESVCGGVIGHDEGILVFFAWVVWGVTLLRHTGIFGYCTSQVEMVVFSAFVEICVGLAGCS